MEFVGFDDWFNLLFSNKIIGIIKFFNNGIRKNLGREREGIGMSHG